MAFAERYDIRAFRHEGKQFAEAPDSALVLNRAARFSLLPGSPQSLCRHTRRVITNFEHAAACIALIIPAVKRVLAVAAVFDALEKRRHHP